MNKAGIICVALLAAIGFTVLPALAADVPVITLERVEVASLQPFYMAPKIAVPTKEDPKKTEDKAMSVGYSSTISLGYVLNIKNPGKEPVMLDELTFTTTFEGFETNTVTSYEDSWIPGGKTNQLRVLAVYEAHPTVLSLSVGSESAQKMQEMKITAPALVKKWWDQIDDFAFPVEVAHGTAVFKDAKGKDIRVSFSGKWGGKAEKK
ncbi:MAG: hypothetical protein HY913_03540 [Desulfomonile tiedjei]|nr:hypothetical protein [Desulfomonile tiedjei]